MTQAPRAVSIVHGATGFLFSDGSCLRQLEEMRDKVRSRGRPKWGEGDGRRDLYGAQGKLQGKLPELKIVRLHRSKTFLLRAPTSLVIYLILLDVYVKLLN